MREPVNRVYEFDNFTVDVAERRVLREEQLVPLTPKAFDTLLVLLENKGKIVEKDVLLSEVWADTFVEEATLAQNISTLRKALGTIENGKPLIETVPRRGYRFIGEVREIIGEDEVLVFERRVRTHIVSEREEIDENKTADTDSREEKTTFVAHSKPVAKRRFLIGGAILTALVLIGAWAATQFAARAKTLAATRFEKTQLTKLTTTGTVHRVAISPDGKYLGLVERRGENQALLVRQIANENTVEIVPAKKQQVSGLTFSPAGDEIYYVAYNREEPPQKYLKGILYKVPLLGGSIRQVSEDVDSPVTFSPDKKEIAFIRNDPDGNQSALIVADIDGKNERKLTVRAHDERFTSGGISWSPDGKAIAATAYSKTPAEVLMDAFVVDVKTGEQKPLMTEKWDWVGQVAWLSDSSGIMFPAYGKQSLNLTDEVWLVEYPSGKRRQVTNGVNGFYGVGITADSNAMVTVKSDQVTNFNLASLDNPDKPHKIRQGFSELSLLPLGMDWTPDGKIVFASAKNSNTDVWIINADGSSAKPLTSDEYADFSPAVAPDGKFIVFLSNRSGRQNLWRMNIDGTEQRQISDGYNVTSPSVAPDSKWIYYSATAGDDMRLFVWKIPSNGGEAVKISEKQTFRPKISPDGKFIGCYYPSLKPEEEAARVLKLTILSAEDGKIVKQFDERAPFDNPTQISWTLDGKNLVFIKPDESGSNLWLQPIEGETAPRQLTDSPDRIFRFAFSNDGKNFIYEKGITINDIILIEDAARKNS